MKYILRDYQKKAVSKMMWSLDLPGNDLIVIPQGGGKSLVISEFAKQYGQPILILQPTKEILEQNAEKILNWTDTIGIFSASLNRKEIKNITLATIGSIYKKPELFKHFKTVIVDECHLVSIKKMNSMYMKFFKAIDIQKIFGMTATPYRQDIMYRKWGKLKWQCEAITTTKMINRHYPGMWNRMLMVLNPNDLLEQNYLTPLKYHDVSIINHYQIPTNKTKSNFDLEEFDQIIHNYYVKIARFINNLPHKNILVFCSTIAQAEELQHITPNSAVITGNTNKKERKQKVIEFKAGKIKTLFNVGIYTTGFDFPELDCLVLLRPTRSLTLHNQILGRVGRIAKGKQWGHIYDFVSNVKNLGELASIEVTKVGGKWNVISNTTPEGYHYKKLYSFKIQHIKKPDIQLDKMI